MRRCHVWFQLCPMVPLLGTAEPRSHTSGTLGKTYLRKVKTLGSSLRERNIPADRHQSQRRSGRECSRCQSRDSSSIHEEDSVEWVFCYSPWRGPQWSRCLHCSPWRTLHWSRGYFLKDPQPVENPCWSRFSREELWPLEDTCWSRFILKDHSSWRLPVLEQGKCVRRRKWQRQIFMN